MGTAHNTTLLSKALFTSHYVNTFSICSGKKKEMKCEEQEMTCEQRAFCTNLK